jgi:parallel beta-helix repeat protein
MKVKAVLGIILTLIMLTGISTLAWYAKPAKAATTHIVPDQYSTIQGAINAASTGDIIEVRNGTYLQPEGLWVNKTVTLMGDYRNVQHTINPATTIIKGYGNADVVYLDASGISISGFTLSNGSSANNGISSYTFNGQTIVNNIISGCGTGVDLQWSNNSVVSNNQISNSMYGINLMYCKNDNITSNTISNGGIYCIQLTTVTNSYIIYNTMSGSFSYGLYAVTSSNGNTVAYNTILSPRLTGIFFGYSSNNNNINHNIVPQAAYGIYLYSSCTSNSIIYNYISNCSSGIRLYSVSSNNASNNKITLCIYGIELVSASSDSFRGNWIERNAFHVHNVSSTGNKFSYNDFINNTVQYDLPPGPNYPYSLSRPWSEHDIWVVKASLSATNVTVGAIVNITAVVNNDGNLGKSETFNVTASDGSKLIGIQTVTNLAAGQNKTLLFQWNTTNMEDSYKHTISVYAIPGPDELDTDNNLAVAGNILIRAPDLCIKAYEMPYITPIFYPNCSHDLGFSYKIEVDVTNQGMADAGPFNVSLSAYWNGTLAWYRKATVAGLQQNATKPVYFDFNPQKLGSYTLIIVADCDNNVPETNKTNNTLKTGITGIIPGDFEGNGRIDATDFIIFLSQYGERVPLPPYPTADFNWDGKVDATDFIIFLEYYGKSIIIPS